MRADIVTVIPLKFKTCFNVYNQGNIYLADCSQPIPEPIADITTNEAPNSLQ